ncbi:Protein of unknown function [Pyronema omphalodes CBS 100304]|uniref:Uncharacterized protein n=1 Tax=Pyronema omphalodes (strain CBS 100304) TaxID=1076935 RepID=U4L6A9_PYROM|nr:Protein of unknown function [Pyronema omphalodes CBS 100304]
MEFRELLMEAASGEKVGYRYHISGIISEIMQSWDELLDNIELPPSFHRSSTSCHDPSGCVVSLPFSYLLVHISSHFFSSLCPPLIFL